MKMKSIKPPDYNKKITIEAVDPDNALFKLLSYIREIGNTGHSFSIIVDPDNRDCRKTFGWDGDGSDRINEITIIPKIKDKKKKPMNPRTFGSEKYELVDR